MGISLQLEIAEQLLSPESAGKVPLERALDLSGRALADGRRALHVLRLKPISCFDIRDALRDTAHSALGSDKAMEFASFGKERLIQAGIGENVLQIAREAIRNSLRHSGKKEVRVEIDYDPDHFSLTIRDRGAGISKELLRDGKPGHFGIQGMRERAERIGAQLTVETKGGTAWRLELPASSAYESTDSATGPSLPHRWVNSIAKFIKSKNQS
jgi:signal transduction histidine kinase